MKAAALALVLASMSLMPPAIAQTMLPSGPGQSIVATTCTACHDLQRIVQAGYSRPDWRNTVAMMINIGAPLQPAQADLVVDYLAKNFPEKPKPPARVIPGPVSVSFRSWTVPTLGARPHDTLAAPDGAIWFTGHMGNLLGRLDPATGRIVEYHPPIARSGPHGLTFDRAGDIWFTANFHGYIGRFDPRDGSFAAYPLPDPRARDPHTPIFDKQGQLIFTVQSANMVGRLDPKTGAINLVASPTPKSNPYGLAMNSKGVFFFDEFGSNKIARLDPNTMAIHEYVLPNADSRPRRIAITKDDIVWYTDYRRGYLGRLDPTTGAVTEFPSPGGRQSRPYAIAVLHDAIWYAETNTRPNALVRFDPKTKQFASWPIPNGGGVVRNMTATADGKGLAFACSGINQIALATIAAPAAGR